MGVTFRSIVIGLALIPLMCMWLAQCGLLWYSGQPTTLSLFPHVMFIIFLIILLNQGLKRWRPRWALTPPEVLVVYTMLCLASCLAGHDMIEILVSTLAHLDRYMPIEGRYREWYPHVPQWLIVTDQRALQSAYLGQESIYDPMNFVPWIKPLAWWSFFIFALCSVMWGLNLVFRKQWTENEKLAYPVIQVPMLLANEASSLLRNRLFWIAFCIAGGIDVLNGLNSQYPLLPRIPIVHVVNLQEFFPERPWRDMGPTMVSFYPFAIAMCFFMPLDLAFSCWFFFLFWKLQRVFASHIGIHGMPGFPFVEEQTAGGYYAMALIALWVTRNHLKRAGRLLLGWPVEGATAWETREIRLAALLISCGAGFLVYFLWCLTSMHLGIVIVFMVLYYLLSISVTRMRAELGPPSHDLHAIGPHFQIVKFLGAPNMARDYPRDLAMFGFLNFFNRAYRGHPMPHGMEAFRISERMRMSNARYMLAMALALVAGTVSAYWAILWVMNKYGAAAQMIGPAELFGRETWDRVNLWFTAPEVHQYAPTYAILIGLVFCLGLSALRMAVAWWPFHPVGYAISGSWAMEQLWMCVFIAWVVKAILLKYGGAKAFRPAVPFFVGLLMGDFMVGCFWNIYGIVMGVQVYRFWPY